EAQRQKTLEQEPQQSVRQWPLLLIGAAAAALPTLVFWLYISVDTTTKTQYNPSDVLFIAIPAPYGGAAGLLLDASAFRKLWPFRSFLLFYYLFLFQYFPRSTAVARTLVLHSSFLHRLSYALGWHFGCIQNGLVNDG